jgi:RNA 2',3'-cyclic 3'-phosphodiesterase
MMFGMRLFVALEPGVEAVEHLEDFLEVRRGADPDLRWSTPAQWHLTLAFMGAAPERVVEDLIDGVGAAAARFAPMDLGISGGGCFPDVTSAKVLWAGVTGGDDLGPLARAVRSAAAVVGAAPEGGPFRPHVTLGRFGRPTEATRWIRVLESYAGPSWTASEVTLVASHLPRERGHRPQYEVLARCRMDRE